MFWRFIRSFPKYAVAAALFIVPTVAFLVWWGLRPKPAPPGRVTAAAATPAAVDISGRIAKVKMNHGRLVLVDNDLYDSETGELLFSGWLKEGMPVKLFWEKDTETILGQYERGFVRYGLDGKEKSRLFTEHPLAVSDDYRWITYAKEKDVWVSDVDWPALAQRNERRLTTIGQFNERYFASNILFGTDRTLVVRNLNQILRVDIAAASVHPTKIPLNEIAKRISPDSKWIAGVMNGKFYCYDVDGDSLKEINIGRTGFNDFQWVGNDRCAVIAAGRGIAAYDRGNHSLEQVCALPGFFNRIGEPSPNGRFVLCSGQAQVVAVDLKAKKSIPLAVGAGYSWLDDETLLFSREVQDSEQRGTWLQKPGSEARRISETPFLVPRRGLSLLKLKAGAVVMTQAGLSRVDAFAGEVRDAIKLERAPGAVLGLLERPSG